MKKVLTAVLALAVLAMFSTTAAAQEPVEYKVTVKAEVVKGSANDHFVTFSGPVHIPEVTLPAGTYIFSLLNSSIVQVSNVDRTEFYAMFFTSPVRRLDTSDKYEMLLVPTNPTAPQRISQWFLPNQATGYEFLYPRAEALGDR